MIVIFYGMITINKDTDLSKNDILSGLCIVLLAVLASFAAFSPNSELEIKWLSKIVHFLSYFGLLFLLLRCFSPKHISSSCFYYLISLFFYSLFSIFHCSNDFVFTNYYNIFILFSLILATQQSKQLAYVYFKIILLFISVCAIICYLSYVLRLGIPFRTASFYEEDVVSVVYADYIFSYLLTNDFILFVRACGLFNEPGLFGTICAFVLIVDDLNFSKKENLLIFIAGCLTFSFAYVILLLIGLVIKYGAKGILPILIFSVAIFVIFTILSNIEISNESFSYLLSRFDFSNDVFGGDSRGSYLLDSYFEKQIYSFNDLLFGYGNGCVNGEGGSTWKIFVVEHGILGASLMIIPLFIGAFKQAKNNRRSLSFVLCFFLSIYQRPQIYNALYFMLLIGGIYFINSNKIDCNKQLSSLHKRNM